MNEENSQADAPSPEQVADSVEAAGPEQEIAQLREALSALKADLDRYRDEALRARAEVDNARKRAQRDVEAAHKFGLERMVDALIPVKDSLDLGLDAAQSATDIKPLQEGMSLTQQMFQAALEKIGVVTLDPMGARFDPERH